MTAIRWLVVVPSAVLFEDCVARDCSSGVGDWRRGRQQQRTQDVRHTYIHTAVTRGFWEFSHNYSALPIPPHPEVWEWG